MSFKRVGEVAAVMLQICGCAEGPLPTLALPLPKSCQTFSIHFVARIKGEVLNLISASELFEE